MYSYVFGSVLTNKFNQNSDVDVLVDFDISTIKDYFSNYMDFKEQMEKLLSKKMDIVENQAVKNPIFTIWNVVVDHLPLLKTEVQKFLKI